MGPVPFGVPATAGPGPRPPAPARRRAGLPPVAVVAGLVAAVVAVALAAGFLLQRSGPVDRRPVVLPDTLAGLPPVEATWQFANSDWRGQLRDVTASTPSTGGPTAACRPGPLINLVVVRGDFRGESDAGLGRPPYTEIGEVSCTHTFQLPDLGVTDGDPKPFTKDSWLVCSRESDRLTVSAFVIIGGDGYEQEAAAAVDQTWALQL